MTYVYNLRTGAEALYSLPPKEAVLHAHMQLDERNYSWWSYPKRVVVSEGRRTVTCGDWTALI